MTPRKSSTTRTPTRTPARRKRSTVPLREEIAVVPAHISEAKSLGERWADAGAGDITDEADALTWRALPADQVALAVAALNTSYATSLARRYIREAAFGDEGLADGIARDTIVYPRVTDARLADQQARVEILRSRELLRRNLAQLTTTRDDADPAAVERLQWLRERIDLADTYALNLASNGNADGLKDRLAMLTEEEQRELWAWADTIRNNTHPDAERIQTTEIRRAEWIKLLRAGVPFFGAWMDEVSVLISACERPATESDIDAWTLTRGNGSLAPSPESWLATLTARGESHRTDAVEWLRIGFNELAAEIVRESQKTAEKENAELRQKLNKQRLSTLPSHTVFPGQLIRSGFSLNPFAGLAKRTQEQKELFVFTEGAEEFINEQAELSCGTMQFSDFTTPEVRAFHGVFRLFTGYGEDHKQFTRDRITVPTSLFYQAAGLTSRKSEARAAVFQGLLDLSRRIINVGASAPIPEPEGQSSGKKGRGRSVKKPQRYIAFGKQTQIVSVSPVWTTSDDQRSPLSAEEAAALAQQWGTNPDKWEGRLPDYCELQLPNIMRQLLGVLVLPGDTLAKLEAGSQEVRGKQAGLNPFDHALLLEIIRTRQWKQRSDDGQRVKSYVERDAFLRYMHTAEKIQSLRNKGLYKPRILEPYEKSIEVLKRAGMIVSWEPEQRATRGVRDIFELAPHVVAGTTSGLQKKSKREQLALLKEPGASDDTDADVPLA